MSCMQGNAKTNQQIQQINEFYAIKASSTTMPNK